MRFCETNRICEGAFSDVTADICVTCDGTLQNMNPVRLGKPNPFAAGCEVALHSKHGVNADDIRCAETGVDRGSGFARLAELSFSPFSWRSVSALLGGRTLLEGFHAHGY